MATGLGVVAAVACAVPADATAAPATWSELAPLGQPQPTRVRPAVGPQRMIVAIVPGGGWRIGGAALLDRQGRTEWWTQLLRSKGVGVHVLSHRAGAFRGAVPRQLADLGVALDRIRQGQPDVPLCVYGTSSGGHLATMLHALRPDVVTCAVSDAGPLDLEAFLADLDRTRGVTRGDFLPEGTTTADVRTWFDTDGHTDDVARLDPVTQTGRISRLFAIEAGSNPDGSTADRSAGDGQGERIRQRIPARTTVRQVHAALDGQETLPTANDLFTSFLDGSPGGAEAAEARRVYGEAADWMLRQAARATPPPRPVGPAPPDARTLAEILAARPIALSLRSRVSRPDSRDRVPVRIRCAGTAASCRGTVRLRFGALASRAVSYRIVPARSTFATVRVPLTRAQRVLLGDHTSVVAKVRMTASSAGRPTGTRTANLRVRRTAALARETASARRAARR